MPVMYMLERSSYTKMNEIETKASELQFAKRPKCEMLKMSKSKVYCEF